MKLGEGVLGDGVSGVMHLFLFLFLYLKTWDFCNILYSEVGYSDIH